MIDANEVFERIAGLVAAKTDADIAKAIGVSAPTISLGRKRNAPPFERICKFADETGMSLDYLLLGRPTKADIDLPLFVEVVDELGGEKSPIGALNASEFARYAAVIYNQVVGVSDANARKKLIASSMHLLELHSQKAFAETILKQGIVRSNESKVAVAKTIAMNLQRLIKVADFTILDDAQLAKADELAKDIRGLFEKIKKEPIGLIATPRTNVAEKSTASDTDRAANKTKTKRK